MSEPEPGRQPDPILAAGGLLERTEEGGVVCIAVVHRSRYEDRQGAPGDWVLPKGKPKPGETLEATATREVLEETGVRGSIVGPSFPSTYEVEGIPKVVTFFLMASEEPPGNNDGSLETLDTSEVLEVVWLEPEEALERLTYASEREVVRQAYGLGAG